MKKLLFSVVALMIATLLFSQDDTKEAKEDISQEIPVVTINDDQHTA